MGTADPVPGMLFLINFAVGVVSLGTVVLLGGAQELPRSVGPAASAP